MPSDWNLCVAPVPHCPAAPRSMSGLKTLSQFRQGSNVALGVDFGLSDWWPDFREPRRHPAAGS